MDVTNQCNLRCVMCYFSDERVYKRKREDISVADFIRTAEQVFPLCAHVSLSFGTEPLLHRQFGELLAITQRYCVPSVGITTNGLLLNENLINQMIQSGLHHIAISVDAATKQTYEKVRVGASFEKLLATIQALSDAKERLGSVIPRIQLNFVLMRSNIEELPSFVRLAHQLRACSVGTIHMVPYENTHTREESLWRHKALCNRMLDEARSLAAEYQIEAFFPENFQDAPTLSLVTGNGRFYLGHLHEEEFAKACCQFPWHFIGIDPYGYVVPCGWWYAEEPMGNIRTESFEAIWNNERYRALRAEHLGGALRATCASCTVAGLGNVNNPNAFRVKKPFGQGYRTGSNS
jgi:radical SAM protein with 4Fe4S-binding SPASM domain